MYLCLKQQLQLVKRESGVSMAAIRTECGMKRQEKQKSELQKRSLSFNMEGFSTYFGTSVKIVVCSIGDPDLNPVGFYLWGTRKV